MTRSTQAACIVCSVILFASLPSGADPPENTHASQKNHASLAQVCRVLVDGAIRKPYGSAWQPRNATTDESVDRLNRNARVVVSFDPDTTPAAALTLIEASAFLDDDTLLKHADQAVRGIMAAQDKTGRIPARAVFWKRAGSDDPPLAEPDRAPTRASLAVMLAFAEHGVTPEEVAGLSSADRLNRNAARAARWLVSRQTQAGGWVVAVPDDAPTGKADRVIRLDTREYRDSSLALMFAAVALDDPVLRKGASNAIAQLRQLRITAAGHMGRGLWGTSYAPNGTPDKQIITDGADFDLLATRNAMLTLLAGHLILDEPGTLELLDECAAVVERLRPADGRWPRFPSRDRPKDGIFTTDPEMVSLDDVLAAIKEVHRLGREEAIVALSAPFEPRLHVAAVLCDLLSDPFVVPSDAPVDQGALFASKSPDSQPTMAQRAWRELTHVR